MGAPKLRSMQLVKDLQSEEEFDVLRDFLLTDPKNVTHSIAFWKQELSEVTDEAERAEINSIITTLKNTLKLQARITATIYSTSEESSEDKLKDLPKVTEEVKDLSSETIQEVKSKKGKHIDPKDVKLRVVADTVIDADKDRILRVKYEKFIKQINVEALKLKLTEMMAVPESVEEAKEMASFILGEGLYMGKKAKKWNQEAIDKFLESCKPAEQAQVTQTETTQEETTSTTDEVDLYKKYACYLGDNLTTIPGIRTEVKFLMSEGKVEEAMEIAAFLLGSGEYADSKPERWSEQKIVEFITDIKEDLKKNPLNLNPEGSTTINPDAAAGKGLEEEKPKKDFETNLSKFYTEIEEQVLVNNLDQEQVKKYIYDALKARKIESLEMYHNTESTSEELESMYTTFFQKFVETKFSEKERQSIDVKAEIIKHIAAAIEAKETGLTNVIKEAMDLYRSRGETVSIKEARKLVQDITKESYPDFFETVMKNLSNKKAKEKVAIVQETSNFQEKHPEIWEQVKDAKSLDDLWVLASELEKTQSFLVISEMITYMISSGNITNDKGEKVNWNKAQIELWINTMFKKADTVAEKQVEETNVTTPETTETPETTPEVVTPDPTPEVVSPETTKEESSQENSTTATTETETTASTEQSTSAQATVEEQSSANSAQETTAETSSAKYPNGLTIPEGDEPYKKLYASNSEGFWEGFVDNIKRLNTEGKSKKEITHILADKIVEIAQNKNLTQCHARNFKRTNVTEMYKVINKKADALGIEGWKI